MSRRKKIKRTLYTTGDNYFDFEINREQNIYDYLCYKDKRKKLLKDLDKNNQFYYHWEWEQYIKNKYDMYDDDKLNEFSRYLNQLIRCGELGNEYMKLFVPVLLTLGLENIINLIFEFSFDSTIPIGWNLLMLFILEVVFGISILAIIKATYNPIFKDNNEKNMLMDYKEIIDDILEKRKEGKEK